MLILRLPASRRVFEGNITHKLRFLSLLRPFLQANSSIGRAAVSKTAGWGFEPLLACHLDVWLQAVGSGLLGILTDPKSPEPRAQSPFQRGVHGSIDE